MHDGPNCQYAVLSQNCLVCIREAFTSNSVVPTLTVFDSGCF